MQAGHHEQHPEEGPGQARGEGGAHPRRSCVMLRVTLAKILEFSEFCSEALPCVSQ